MPEPLRHAIRILVTDWYENRGDTGTDAVNALPALVRALIAAYARVRLA